jgi:hypothetical protein
MNTLAHSWYVTVALPRRPIVRGQPRQPATPSPADSGAPPTPEAALTSPQHRRRLGQHAKTPGRRPGRATGTAAQMRTCTATSGRTACRPCALEPDFATGAGSSTACPNSAHGTGRGHRSTARHGDANGLAAPCVPHPRGEATGDPTWPSRTWVSAIIPARNAAATMGAQLDALSLQSYDGWQEVLVVDNGSLSAWSRPGGQVPQFRTRRHQRRA